MAVPFTKIPTPHDGNVAVYEWGPMALNDVGAPLVMASHADKCAHAFGTFGAGGAVRMEGSTEADPETVAHFDPLNDPSMAVFTLSSAGPLKQVLEHPYLIRPHVTAGDANTALT